MKKLFVLFVGLSLALTVIFASSAQESKDGKWLLSLWTGILSGKEKTRTIEIYEIDEGGTIAKARYGITGEKMYPITIAINDDQILFKTPANAKADLKRTSEIRMDGLFEMKGGKTLPIRLWKNVPATDLDPKLKAFLGVWQGKWEWEGAPWGKPDLKYDVKITVAYIDSTTAAVLYEYSDFVSLEGNHVKASWCWYHGTVTRKKTIECQSWDGRGVFIYKLSSDQKHLSGEKKGLGIVRFTPNSAKLRRADE